MGLLLATLLSMKFPHQLCLCHELLLYLEPEVNPPTASAAPSLALLGSITGIVRTATNNDNDGTVKLLIVLMMLLDESRVVVRTTDIDCDSNYLFTNFPEGSFRAMETNISSYFDVSDIEAANGICVVVVLSAFVSITRLATTLLHR